MRGRKASFEGAQKNIPHRQKRNNPIKQQSYPVKPKRPTLAATHKRKKSKEKKVQVVGFLVVQKKNALEAIQNKLSISLCRCGELFAKNS